MVTINIFNGNKAISTQDIHSLHTHYIPTNVGDKIIVDNLENIKIVTRKSGNDLLFFFNYSKEPVVVLQDYFKDGKPAVLEMQSMGETFVYQPDNHTWLSGEPATLEHELSQPIEVVSGGGGASTGIPPLVWGLGALATLGGAVAFIDDNKEQKEHKVDIHADLPLPEKTDKPDDEEKKGTDSGTEENPDDTANTDADSGKEENPDDTANNGADSGTEENPDDTANNGADSGTEENPDDAANNGADSDAENKPDDTANNGADSGKEENPDDTANTDVDSGKEENPDDTANNGADAGTEENPDDTANAGADAGKEENPDDTANNGADSGTENKPDDTANNGADFGTRENPDDTANNGADSGKEENPDDTANNGADAGTEENPDDTTNNGADSGTEENPDDAANNGADSGTEENPDDTANTGADAGTEENPDDTANNGADAGSEENPDDTANNGADSGAEENPDDTANNGADSGSEENPDDTANTDVDSGKEENPDDTANNGAGSGTEENPDDTANNGADSGKEENPDDTANTGADSGSEENPDDTANTDVDSGAEENPDDTANNGADSGKEENPDDTANNGADSGTEENPDDTANAGADSAPVQPAYLSIHQPTTDNGFWRQGQPVSLMGEARNVSDGEEVTVQIGGQHFSATVENSSWHLELSPAQMALLAGGLQTISAFLNQDGKVVHSSTESVFIESATPATGKIVIDEDKQDTSLSEAGERWRVSGHAEGISDDANVMLSFTNNKQLFYGEIDAGRWSVDVDTNYLKTLGEDIQLPYHVFIDDAGKTSVISGRVNLDFQPNGSVTLQNFKEQVVAGEDLVIEGDVKDLGYGEGSRWSYYVNFNDKNYATGNFIASDDHFKVTIPAADLENLPVGKQQFVNLIFADGQQRQINIDKPFTMTSDEHTPLLTINPISNNSVINYSEHGQELQLTGKAEKLSDRDSLELTFNGKIYQPTILDNGTWSLTIPAHDVKALDNHHTYTADLVVKEGEYAGLNTRAGVSVQANPIFTIDPITGDNLLQTQDLKATLPLSGRADNLPDDSVIVVDFNGKQYSGIVRDGRWSLTIGKEDLQGLKDQESYPIIAHLGERSTTSTLKVDFSEESNQLKHFTTREDTTLAEALEYWKIIQAHDKITAVDTSNVPIPADGSGIADSDVTFIDRKVIEDNIMTLNALRAFNKLDPVSITSDQYLDLAMQKGAIAMAAEGYIDHGLKNFRHRDPEGIEVTERSVLAKTGGNNTVSEYIIDDFNLFPGAGHRVQLFSPTYGYTTLGAAKKDDLYTYSGMPTLYKQLINKHAYIPETSEWPAAGYMPYALMPKKAWTFATNQIGKDEKVDITIVRTTADGEKETFHVDPSRILRSDVRAQVSESPYQTVLTFEPFQYQKDQYNRVTSLVLKQPQGVDIYQVNILAGDKHWHYDVKVFDESSSAYNHLGDEAVSSPTTAEPAQPSDVYVNHQLLTEETTFDHSGHEISFNHLNLDLLNTGDGAEQVTGKTLSSTLNLAGGDDAVHLETLQEGANLSLGYGDDWLWINSYQGGKIDGGAGHDTLHFDSSSNVLNLEHVTNFETIDLGSKTEQDLPNVLNIKLENLIENQDEYGQLTIKGSAGNKVTLLESEIQSITEVERDGQTYHDIHLSNGSLNGHLIIADNLYLNGEGVIIL